ncbi:membrane protein [Staphylococcus phage CF7]|nr:membrane protein [Staphylococcus phage CF7]
MVNNIWAVVLSIIILFTVLLILWFLFRKKIGGSSNQGKVQEVRESKEGSDKEEQKVEEAQYRELNEEEKRENTSEKDYKYDKDKVRNKLKELE